MLCCSCQWFSFSFFFFFCAYSRGCFFFLFPKRSEMHMQTDATMHILHTRGQLLVRLLGMFMTKCDIRTGLVV